MTIGEQFITIKYMEINQQCICIRGAKGILTKGKSYLVKNFFQGLDGSFVAQVVDDTGLFVHANANRFLIDFNNFMVVPPTNVVFPLKELLEMENKFEYVYTQKIPAIKYLREIAGCYFPLRLADAKWAVENWTKWKEFIKANNRLPISGYAYSGQLK